MPSKDERLIPYSVAKKEAIYIFLFFILVIAAGTFEKIIITADPYDGGIAVLASRWWGLKTKYIPIRFFSDKIPGYDNGGWATFNSKTKEWDLVIGGDGDMYIRWK